MGRKKKRIDGRIFPPNEPKAEGRGVESREVKLIERDVMESIHTTQSTPVNVDRDYQVGCDVSRTSGGKSGKDSTHHRRPLGKQRLTNRSPICSQTRKPTGEREESDEAAILNVIMTSEDSHKHTVQRMSRWDMYLLSKANEKSNDKIIESGEDNKQGSLDSRKSRVGTTQTKRRPRDRSPFRIISRCPLPQCCIDNRDTVKHRDEDQLTSKVCQMKNKPKNRKKILSNSRRKSDHKHSSNTDKTDGDFPIEISPLATESSSPATDQPDTSTRASHETHTPLNSKPPQIGLELETTEFLQTDRPDSVLDTLSDQPNAEHPKTVEVEDELNGPDKLRSDVQEQDKPNDMTNDSCPAELNPIWEETLSEEIKEEEAVLVSPVQDKSLPREYVTEQPDEAGHVPSLHDTTLSQEATYGDNYENIIVLSGNDTALPRGARKYVFVPSVQDTMLPHDTEDTDEIGLAPSVNDTTLSPNETVLVAPVHGTIRPQVIDTKQTDNIFLVHPECSTVVVSDASVEYNEVDTAYPVSYCDDSILPGETCKKSAESEEPLLVSPAGEYIGTNEADNENVKFDDTAIVSYCRDMARTQDTGTNNFHNIPELFVSDIKETIDVTCENVACYKIDGQNDRNYRKDLYPFTQQEKQIKDEADEVRDLSGLENPFLAGTAIERSINGPEWHSMVQEDENVTQVYGWEKRDIIQQDNPADLYQDDYPRELNPFLEESDIEHRDVNDLAIVSKGCFTNIALSGLGITTVPSRNDPVKSESNSLLYNFDFLKSNVGKENLPNAGNEAKKYSTYTIIGQNDTKGEIIHSDLTKSNTKEDEKHSNSVKTKGESKSKVTCTNNAQIGRESIDKLKTKDETTTQPFDDTIVEQHVEIHSDVEDIGSNPVTHFAHNDLILHNIDPPQNQKRDTKQLFHPKRYLQHKKMKRRVRKKQKNECKPGANISLSSCPMSRGLQEIPRSPSNAKEDIKENQADIKIGLIKTEERNRKLLTRWKKFHPKRYFQRKPVGREIVSKDTGVCDSESVHNRQPYKQPGSNRKTLVPQKEQENEKTLSEETIVCQDVENASDSHEDKFNRVMRAGKKHCWKIDKKQKEFILKEIAGSNKNVSDPKDNKERSKDLNKHTAGPMYSSVKKDSLATGNDERASGKISQSRWWKFGKRKKFPDIAEKDVTCDLPTDDSNRANDCELPKKKDSILKKMKNVLKGRAGRRTFVNYQSLEDSDSQSDDRNTSSSISDSGTKEKGETKSCFQECGLKSQQTTMEDRPTNCRKKGGKLKSSIASLMKSWRKS